MLIFEDDDDRLRFLRLAWSLIEEYDGDLLAYCLMDNHVHLLVRLELSQLSLLMQRFCTSYARYFNRKHDRVGHLFQDRFFSEPVSSDEQLLATIRYIHRNPVKAGMSDTCDYPWSSYSKYLEGPRSSGAQWVLRVFGGIEDFVIFHAADANDCGAVGESKLTDQDVVEKARAVLEGENIYQIKELPKAQRDSLVRKLKSAGFSTRQIERLTGISRCSIGRA